jgi:hypothetical protein
MILLPKQQSQLSVTAESVVRNTISASVKETRAVVKRLIIIVVALSFFLRM